jgi:pyruvate dehydrogenase E1 component alpha subunit
MKKLTKNDLINFEKKVADLFNNKKIRSPVHLYSGNEGIMINIFKKIKNEDWVLCSWRSHYQCLLKGVPEKILLNRIIKGHSISLSFAKQKIFSSAIVGGVLPIALGIALALKIKKSKEQVFCFIGDMTSETGIAHECIKYAENFKLPIKFIIEDNNLSVCTDTRKTWGLKKLTYENYKSKKIIYYKYKNKYPHAGAGVRVQF